MVELAKETYKDLKRTGQSLETDPFFVSPFLMNSDGIPLSVQDWLSNYQLVSGKVRNALCEMDDVSIQLFSINQAEKKALFDSTRSRPTPQQYVPLTIPLTKLSIHSGLKRSYHLL